MYCSDYATQLNANTHYWLSVVQSSTCGTSMDVVSLELRQTTLATKFQMNDACNEQIKQKRRRKKKKKQEIR